MTVTGSKACWSKALTILPLVTPVTLSVWSNGKRVRKPICPKIVWEKSNLDEAEDSSTSRNRRKMLWLLLLCKVRSYGYNLKEILCREEAGIHLNLSV